MIDRTPLGYSETFGLRPLREAIAGHYRRWYDLDVTGRADRGDHRLVGGVPGRPSSPPSTPVTGWCWPGRAIPRTATSCPVWAVRWSSWPAGRPSGSSRPGELLDAALADGPVAGLVLASPANPTGTMVDHDQLADLAGWCREHGVRLVSDEIYHGIVDASVARRVGVGCCAWQHDRSAVIISSFSKYWGMTGWRLGWALVPDDLWPAWMRWLATTRCARRCRPSTRRSRRSPRASYAEAEAAVREFAAARSLVLDAVDDLGWTKVAPADGAFYVWADIADQLGPHPDSGAWCAALLDAEGVAVTPGSDFDTVDGRHGDQALVGRRTRGSRRRLAADPSLPARARAIWRDSILISRSSPVSSTLMPMKCSRGACGRVRPPRTSGMPTSSSTPRWPTSGASPVR